jgi:hypothetical protein
MPVLSFESDADVAEFAEKFLGEHVERFDKDIAICLRRDNESHAYFPALITCIAFAELLSGLHVGDLESRDALKNLDDYASDFMDRTVYDSDRLEILYKMFRHKVAHLAQPYAVFDAKPKSPGQPRRLITWTVDESATKPAIEIVPEPETKQILNAVTPWPVFYNHRAYVRIESLASDIRESIPRYLQRLKTDNLACGRFKACMKDFYPRPR